MTIDETIRSLELAREVHGGEAQVMIAPAASGNPKQEVSGIFPLLQVATDHGVVLIQSNRMCAYIPAVFPDSPPLKWQEES